MAVKKLSIKKHKGKLVIHKKGSKDGEPAQEPAEEELQKETSPSEIEGEEQIVAEEAPHKSEDSNTDDAGGGGVGTLIVDGKKVGKVTKLKIKSKQGAQVKAKVTVKKEGEDEQVEEEVLEEIEVSKHMANVGFSVARSINMGNFESLKVQVSINVPSEVDEDEIEGNYEYAKGWCEEKMNALVDEYTDEVDEGGE